MGPRRRYPSSFAEWMVGANFENVLRARAKKQSRQKDVVRVEVTTDDETGEDTIRVTYPHLRRLVHASNGTEIVVRDVVPEPVVAEADPETAVKKVRFDEVPIKSALRKACAATPESEGQEPAGQESEAQASASQASDSNVSTQPSQDSSEAGSSETLPEKPKKTKKAKKRVKSPGSVCHSEPHPTCKCRNCVRGRAKARKQAKADAARASTFDSETSISEPDRNSASEKPQKSKYKKKAALKSPETSDDTGTDQQTCDSVQSSDASVVPVQKTAPKSKEDSKKQRSREKESQREREPEKSKEKTAAAKISEEAYDDGEKDNADQKSEKKKMDNSSGGRANKSSPEAASAPHPQHPQHIEPMHSEVVQTERVLETAQDPPPNAYCDAANKVLRVYYGSVYGGHGHALCARPGAPCFPLPIGMPSATEYPWYQGFSQPLPHLQGYSQPPSHLQGFSQPPLHMPPHLGQEQIRFSGGMPNPPWHVPCPPPGPSRYTPVDLAAHGAAHGARGVTSANKGAFSNFGPNFGSPVSKIRDASGTNNVGPNKKLDEDKNPYYGENKLKQDVRRNQKSPDTRNLGVSRAASAPNGINGDIPGWGSPDDPWGCLVNPKADQGGKLERDTATNSADNQKSGWDNSTVEQGIWAENIDSGQDVQASKAKAGSSADNFMPGAFPNQGPIQYWADPTLAASTNSQVNAPYSELPW